MPVYDNFDRADGGLGGNWTTFDNYAPTISSNQVQASTNNSDNGAFWTTGIFSPNQWAQAVVTQRPYGQGPAVRCAGSGNCYYLSAAATTQLRLWKQRSGSWSQLGSTISGTCAVDDVIKLEVIGNTIYCYQNGVLLLTHTDSTNTLTSGNPGIYLYSTTAGLDSFAAGSCFPTEIYKKARNNTLLRR